MEVPPTALRLPASLPYPLTVQRIHARPGTTVYKTHPLLTYSFVPPKPDEDGRRERQVRVWESPVEGEVVSWAAREGDVIRDHRNAIVKIKEPCTHDVQLHGLCALCGKDLNAVDYTGFSDTSRATISMVHDVGGLTVSLDEAHRLESATTTRLLSAEKLSLIVDLDQTIVHATVDPTVGEWLQDPKNPNYKALEGVGKFKLVDEVPATKRKKRKTTRPPGMEGSELVEESEEEEEQGCWYYIKMRPGLPDFLKRIAQKYEMHVYTMGTRAYASEVCKVIDPDGGLFGGRILSRDESGSMTRKSLQRLFPCDTNMVVIIDDRADVWDGSPNLVKVIPYEFFVGIGDINAAFLPKKKELVPPPSLSRTASALDSPSSAEPSSPSNASEAGKETTPPTSPDSPTDGEKAEEHILPESVESQPTRISDLVVDSSPSEIVSPSLDEASTAAALTIHDVIEARPLEKAQREADSHHHQHDHGKRKSENGSASPEGAVSQGQESDENGAGDEKGVGEEADAEGEDEEVYEEEAVLKDDDRELDRLFDILSNVHGKFFEEHKTRSSADVASIIPALKRQSLRSTHLVFSGLVALGSRPEDSEYWKLATTFGARCSADLSSSVTHLVANQAGTVKVHSARRNPRIKIVYPQWLLDSVAHWTRCDESPYLLPAPETTSPPGSPIRPELSEEEDEEVGGSGEAVDKGKGRAVDAILHDVEEGEGGIDALPDGELDLDDLDWGDAMKEVDDLLDETDDEDTASLLAGGNGTDGGESDTGSVCSAAPRARKRPRMSTPEDGLGGGSGGGRVNGKKAAAAATESPLQKRVKMARSRKSGLKTTLSAAAMEAAAASPEGARGAAAVAERQPSVEAAGFPGSSQASQASSSLDSDDDDLLASMVAEVEKGWS
ncbi:hypothetical protein JCM11251_002452 [Rhodosporidiobolus azoricus]